MRYNFLLMLRLLSICLGEQYNDLVDLYLTEWFKVTFYFTTTLHLLFD